MAKPHNTDTGHRARAWARNGAAGMVLAILASGLIAQADDPLARAGAAELRQDFPAAYAALAEAITARPQAHQAYLARARIHAKLQRPALALADLARARELDAADPKADLMAGGIWLANDAPIRAIAAFDAALERVPDLVGALAGRAAAQMRAGRPDAALADYDAALALAPDDPDLAIERDRLLAQIDTRRAARITYDPAALLDPAFRIDAGDADAPHHLLIVEAGSDLAGPDQRPDDDSLAAAIASGQVRISRLFTYTGADSSIWTNLALICAGADAFPALRAALTIEAGRDAVATIDSTGDLDPLRTLLSGAYAAAGVAQSVLEDCAFSRTKAVRYLADWSRKRDDYEWKGVNYYDDWPVYIWDETPQTAAEIETRLAEVAPPAGGVAETDDAQEPLTEPPVPQAAGLRPDGLAPPDPVPGPDLDPDAAPQGNVNASSRPADAPVPAPAAPDPLQAADDTPEPVRPPAPEPQSAPEPPAEPATPDAAPQDLEVSALPDATATPDASAAETDPTELVGDDAEPAPEPPADDDAPDAAEPQTGRPETLDTGPADPAPEPDTPAPAVAPAPETAAPPPAPRPLVIAEGRVPAVLRGVYAPSLVDCLAFEDRVAAAAALDDLLPGMNPLGGPTIGTVLLTSRRMQLFNATGTECGLAALDESNGDGPWRADLDCGNALAPDVLTPLRLARLETDGPAPRLSATLGDGDAIELVQCRPLGRLGRDAEALWAFDAGACATEAGTGAAAFRFTVDDGGTLGLRVAPGSPPAAGRDAEARLVLDGVVWEAATADWRDGAWEFGLGGFETAGQRLANGLFVEMQSLSGGPTLRLPLLGSTAAMTRLAQCAPAPQTGAD